MAEMDCRAAADHWRRVAVEPELAALGLSPRLVTLVREGDAAAARYERALARRCAGLDHAGLTVHHQACRVTSRDQGLGLIAELNRDASVHGIMVLYPLGLSPDTVFMNAVDPHKDVEGLHALNLGYLQQYKRTLDPGERLKLTVPCTAKAVGKALDYYQVPVAGHTVVIYNNSLILGRPLGTYLENLGATVVRTFDRTPREFQDHVLARARVVITGVPAASALFDHAPAGSVVINVSGVTNFPPAALASAALHTDRIGPLTCEMAILQTIYVARRARETVPPLSA
jgi:methylenetetrahydrofolate dehydrogenase (NADP+)/methenyltetrahydrofolate cyclohydrolase